MIKPGPDSMDGSSAVQYLHCSGFSANDPHISGFSHARLHGAGIVDYGSVALMPVGEMSPDYVTRAGHQTTWSDRAAAPGYFRITLGRGPTEVELTATDRVAVHRYTFAAGADQGMLVDAAHVTANDVDILEAEVTVDATTRTLTGFTHFAGGYSDRYGGSRVYFAARFSRGFESHGVWSGDTLSDGATHASGVQAGAWVTFDSAESDVVVAEVAVSFVDVAGALANLTAESPGFDFDAAREATTRAWDDRLARVRVEGPREPDIRRFYTALYQTQLMPTLASDVDGRYRGLDGAVHTSDFGDYYTDFSLWDTFRTLHPLLTLLYSEQQAAFLRSFEAMARDGGAMPRWPLATGYTGGMLGEPAAIMFADAWVKGLRDYDLQLVWDALEASAMGTLDTEHFSGRGAAAPWAELGYIPDSMGGSVSRTLEFAYADAALATLAEAVGDVDAQAKFTASAGNWRNVWDASRGFFVGRDSDGAFDEKFSASKWEDFYVEGNAHQYLWYVPHDLAGLAETMGGVDTALARLDELFEASRAEERNILPPTYYWHGNEPDIHAPYIFAALGDHARTAIASRWVLREMYGDGVDGLPGNDDGGTLSAWYVFSALGLYPLAGSPDYIVGSPIFTRARLALNSAGTKVLEILAPATSDTNLYVEGLTLDGQPVTAPRLAHDALSAGGTLRFEMVEEPATTF